MNVWKKMAVLLAAMLLAVPGFAQTEVVEREVNVDTRKAETAERLRAAEERMEAAAREIAEITHERLPQIRQIERRIEISKKPRIGVTISGDEKSDPVEGILVDGVSPGGAADDAGLRAGDIIVAVNGESMSASSSMKANRQLLDFMDGVEEGDELKVDYLRGGNRGSVKLVPRVSELHAFAWAPDGGRFEMHGGPDHEFAPGQVDEFRFGFGFPLAGSAFGSMELVELNEGLGKYFGTDSGLLVVSAPKAPGLDLRDGDVIQTIDNRKPSDVRHALRILGSYESGEKIKLGIMRDKKKRTVEIEVPADRRGSIFAPPPAAPVRAPAPARAPYPDAAST
jgi:C-terminal processing protease CtpA/Prc